MIENKAKCKTILDKQNGTKMTPGANGPQLYNIKDGKVISPQGEPFSIKFALEYIYGYQFPDVAEQGNRAERRKRNR